MRHPRSSPRLRDRGVGTWGYGPFENDDALDWAAELGDSGDPGFPAGVLAELDELEFVGRREGCAGIAAAEAVAASRGRPYDPLPEPVQEWLAATGARADTRTRDLAVRVIGKIENSDESELRLLWDEQPDDEPSWRQAIGDLRRRLREPARKAGSRPPVRRPRIRLGDVVELTTSAGLSAYIQLIGEMGPGGGDLIRVLPGFFAAPLDDEGLAALAAGESVFLSGGFFKSMITREGGRPRGNYPVPAALAGPQPLRTGLSRFAAPGSWSVTFDGRELLTAQEFAHRHPDVDQTMLAAWGSFPGTDTLVRMIECEWRPWMDHYDVSWMYLKGSSRPKRRSPYPATAVPGKFLTGRY